MQLLIGLGRWLLPPLVGALALAAGALAQTTGDAPGANATGDDKATAAIMALEANALYQTGKTADARTVAQAATDIDPVNEVALRVLAMAAETAPDWRQAAAAWDEVARVAEPGEAAEFARARGDAIARTSGAFATLEAFFLGDSGNDEQYGLRADGRFARRVGPSVIAGLETRTLKDDEAFGGKGPLASVDEDRLTGRLGLEAYPGFGRTRMELVSNGDITGIDGAIDRRGRDWRVGLAAAVNRPYYDFSQGAAFDAALDEIELTGMRSFGPAHVDVQLGARNYMIEDREDVSDSFRLAAGLSYRIGTKVTAPRLAARFDGEYVSEVSEVDIGARRKVSPLPLRDLEVLSLGLHKRFEPFATPDSYIDAGAGYREDIDRANGGFVRVEGQVRVAPEIALGINAEYSDVSAQRAEFDSFTAVTLSLTRTFTTLGRLP